MNVRITYRLRGDEDSTVRWINDVEEWHDENFFRWKMPDDLESFMLSRADVVWIHEKWTVDKGEKE